MGEMFFFLEKLPDFSFLPAPVSRAFILHFATPSHTHTVAWLYMQAVWKAVFHMLNEECAWYWNCNCIGPLLKRK
jgi:hypothetical protein